MSSDTDTALPSTLATEEVDSSRGTPSGVHTSGVLDPAREDGRTALLPDKARSTSTIACAERKLLIRNGVFRACHFTASRVRAARCLPPQNRDTRQETRSRT